MEFLRNAKIPIPQILMNIFGKQVSMYKSKDSVWSYILMDFVVGKHPKSYSKKTIKHLATTQAKMHQLGVTFAKNVKTPKPFWRHLRERAFSPHIKVSTIRNAVIKDFVIRAKKFEATLLISLPQAYNHLDITHDNILVQNNQVVAVLDFDDAGYSPSVVCLGYTLWDMLYITRNVQSIFTYLSHYVRHRKLTEDEVIVLKDVLLFRNYVIGSLEILFYGENAREAKLIIKFEKIINELNIGWLNK